MALPATMRAAVLSGFDDPKTQLVVKDIPLPSLRPGEVLVRMSAAAINPSDLVFLRDQYGVHKKPPVVPGFEGSGTVVAADAGVYGRWLIGRRVAVRPPEDGNGTWAEYMASPAKACIPLLKRVSLEQGATLIVNPLTAWALLDLAQRGRHRAIVQTAAASALGRMIIRLARRRQIKTISIVRHQEQIDALRADGADYVLDSTREKFTDELKALSRQAGATLALDAVGGMLLNQVAGALPRNSSIVVYGALSGEACSVPAHSLIFEGKSVRGFWLTEWVKSQSLMTRLGMVREVQGLVKGPLATRVLRRYPLEQIHEAMDFYKKNRSEGKAVLTL